MNLNYTHKTNQHISTAADSRKEQTLNAFKVKHNQFLFHPYKEMPTKNLWYEIKSNISKVNINKDDWQMTNVSCVKAVCICKPCPSFYHHFPSFRLLWSKEMQVHPRSEKLKFWFVTFLVRLKGSSSGNHKYVLNIFGWKSTGKILCR